MAILMKELMRKAAERLQLEALTEEGALDGTLELDAERELEAVLACANAVYREAAAESCPLATWELLDSEGVIAYGDLQKVCVKVLRVEDIAGKKVRAKLSPLGIRTGEGRFRIYYCYLPDEVELSGSLAFEEGTVSSDVLAAGIAAEYLLRNGMYQEAEAWERRYRDGLDSLRLNTGRYVAARNFCA